MRKVNLPDCSLAFIQLDRALKYRNGSYKHLLTEEEKNIIKKIYDKYDLLKGSIHDEFKSTLLQPSTNNALENAYSEVQIKGRLCDLRSYLLLLIDRCPYCGINPADELDHYLPKSTYQAVSIYPQNLIPICHTCNNAKRTAINNGDNKTFYNAYHESFPNVAVLIAETNFTGNNLIINFDIDSTLSNSELKEKLRFQFERSKLNERLLKEANTFIFDKKSSIEVFYDADPDNGVKKLFEKDYNEYLARYGLNHWKTALVLALSKCDNFCKGGFKKYFGTN